MKAESLNRSNELEEMQQRLDDRKFVTGDMSMQSKIVEEDIKKKEERLGLEVRSLLVAGTALSVSRNRLQVILVNTCWIDAFILPSHFFYSHIH